MENDERTHGLNIEHMNIIIKCVELWKRWEMVQSLQNHCEGKIVQQKKKCKHQTHELNKKNSGY